MNKVCNILFRQVHPPVNRVHRKQRVEAFRLLPRLPRGAMSSRGLEIPSFCTSHFLHTSRSVEVWNCTGNDGLFHPFPLTWNPCHSLLSSTLLEVWKCGILRQTRDYFTHFPWPETLVILYLVLHFWKCGSVEYCDKLGIISPISPDLKPLSFFT